MASAEARGRILGSVLSALVFRKLPAMIKKTAENLGFLQFSLYTKETIPYDANERPQKKPTERKLYMGKIGYFKGEIWLS